MGVKVARNQLDKLEIEVARELEKKRRKRRTWPEGNKTRIAKQVRAGGVGVKGRKPPPVPKNKSLKEIIDMPADSPEFKHDTGRPRRSDKLNPETDDWKTVARADHQKRFNERRARARKAEATVVKAAEVLKTHSNSKQHKMDIYDEERVIAEGVLALDDWDDDELARGYRRNRNGRFGRAPAYVPREIQQEAFRRLIARGERRMKEAYMRVVENLVDLATNSSSDKVRLEAQKELMNRVVGKVPDRIQVGMEQPWEGFLADSMVPISEVPAIDMEVDEDGVARLPYVPLDEGGDEVDPDSGGSAAEPARPRKRQGPSSSPRSPGSG